MSAKDEQRYPRTAYPPVHDVRVELVLDLPGGAKTLGARAHILADPYGDTRRDLEAVKRVMEQLTHKVEDAVREALDLPTVFEDLKQENLEAIRKFQDGPLR